MLTHQENELLCRVVADAPMGQLMRRHWNPVCLIEEVSEPDGTVLVDQTVRTQDNGFAGLWLPADLTATLTVEHEGRTASTPITTGADAPTCLTTLQLR